MGDQAGASAQPLKPPIERFETSMTDEFAEAFGAASARPGLPPRHSTGGNNLRV